VHIQSEFISDAMFIGCVLLLMLDLVVLYVCLLVCMWYVALFLVPSVSA
jgi:hypothetical protein